MNPFEAKKVLVCHLCDKKFKYGKSLADHIKKHTTNNLNSAKKITEPKVVYECQDQKCGQIFSNTKSGIKHCQEKHEHIMITVGNKIDIQTLDLVPLLKPKSTCSLLLCEFCDMPFISTVHLIYHTTNHNPRLGYQCLNCDEKKTTVLKIQKHREEESDLEVFDSLIKIDINRSYFCNVCENEFDELQKLYEHRFMTLHLLPLRNPDTNVLQYNCDQCMFYSTSKDDYIKHYTKNHRKNVMKIPSKKIVKIKTAQTVFICDICKKQFRSKDCIKQHLKFHLKTKKFICTYNGCKKEFTLNSDLQNHIRKDHTHQRPFLCKHCGKSFSTSSVFYQHRKIHTGVGKFKCDVCHRAFRRTGALKTHLLIHTGEKPYRCAHCSHQFRQKGDIKIHIKRVHKIRAIVQPTN